MPERKPVVIIVGGGFGGLAAARALKKAPVKVLPKKRDTAAMIAKMTKLPKRAKGTRPDFHGGDGDHTALRASPNANKAARLALVEHEGLHPYVVEPPYTIRVAGSPAGPDATSSGPSSTSRRTTRPSRRSFASTP